jgi:sporulation protein YlmC with PRC-barrel domain
MERYKFNVMVLAVLILFFGSNAFAQTGLSSEKKGGSKEMKGYEPSKGERINAFMAEKIIGSRVQNMQGVDLGVIKDVVIDVDTGRVLYAILDFGGFLGMGGKLFPVPWHSLAPLPSEGIFFMNVTRAKLEKAPGFNENNLPDMGDVHWGETINQFYEPPQRQGGYDSYDYEYGYGYPYGPELYPGIAQKDPFAKTFDPESLRKITGMVIKVDSVVPKSGLFAQMELELIIHPKGKEPIPVFVGPLWYVVSPERKRPFKSGDEVTVTGSWVAPEGTPFMIATSVTKGDETLQLRHQDGTPMWNAWKIGLNKQ